MDRELVKFLQEKKLFIFDFDGTMTDSLDFIYSTFAQILHKRGIQFGVQDFNEIRMTAKSLKMYVDGINERYGTDISLFRCAYEFSKVKRNLKKSDHYKCYDYVNELLQRFPNATYVVLSNQYPDSIETSLKKWGIRDNFEEIISCAEQEYSKGDYYIKLQLKYNCLANECVIFEDSQYYIDQAREMMFDTVGVEHKFNKNEISANHLIKIDAQETILEK